MFAPLHVGSRGCESGAQEYGEPWTRKASQQSGESHLIPTAARPMAVGKTSLLAGG